MILPFRKPTTDVAAFIAREEAAIAVSEAKERDLTRRTQMALETLDEMLIEGEYGAPERMIRAAESETTITLIRAALERADVDGALRLCIGQ